MHAPVARPGSSSGLKPGRPPDRAKHDRILTEATQAFLEFGFNATSMDLVARRAGVSKVTVYSHFRNKEVLFGAIIDALAGRLSTRIHGFVIGGQEPRDALRQLGRAYLDLALASSSLALHRVVVAESARISGLGRVIFENGPAQVVAALAAFLARQKTLAIADPRLAAEQFLGMVLGHAQLRLLLHARPAREVRGGIGRVVDHAVEIFLNGVERPARRRRA